VANLHIDITGDCTGATTALGNTQAAISRLNNTQATVSVGVVGTDNAVTGLNRVQAARVGASGDARVGVDTSGLDAGRASLRGFSQEVRAANRDLVAAGGSRVFGVRDDGSLGDITQRIGTASQALQGLGAGSSSLGQIESDASRSAQSLGGVEAGLRDVGASASDATPMMRQAAMVMAGGGEGASLAESAIAGSRAVRTLDADMASASGSAQRLSGQAIAVGRALNVGGLPGGFNAFNNQFSGVGVPGTGHGPPSPPRFGGGGGGGGGRGGEAMPGSGDSRKGSGLGGLGQPLLMAGVIGAGSALVAAGVGALAVNEAIKRTPDLAYAASQAMGAFDRSITNAASSAVTQGVPALHELGQALVPLGTEIGTVGAQQIGNVLGGATTLATSARTALQSLEPAIGPSITAITNLGNAILKGIADPTVAGGIQGVAESLSSPQVGQVVQAATVGVVSASTAITKALVDVTGAAAGIMDMIGIPTAAAGPSITGLTGGAILGAKVGGAKGGLVGGVLGLTAGLGTSLEQQRGIDTTPTLLDEIGGAGLGFALGGPVGALAGGLAGEGFGAATSTLVPEQYRKAANDVGGGALAGAAAGALIGSAFGGIGAIPGALIGATLGAGAGGAYAAYSPGGYSQDPSGRGYTGGFPSGVSAPYGWSEDQQGNLTPLGRGGQVLPQAQTSQIGAASSQVTQLGQSASNAAPQVQQLSTSATTAAPQVQQLGQHANTAAPSMLQFNQSTNQMSQSVTQLHQAVQPATQTIQQLGQVVQPTAQAVQQLPNAVQPAMQSLSQLPQQAAQQLNTANSAVAAGGTNIGAQVPNAMAQGINQNTAQACNASANLAANTAKCAASVLQTASPSKVFVGLGQSTGQGLAVGISGSFGAATGAVSSAMGAVVSAGAAGLDAHSPSQIFVAYGAGIPEGLSLGIQSTAGTAVAATQQMLSQVTQGARQQITGAQTLLGTSYNQALRTALTQPTNPTTGQQPPRYGQDQNQVLRDQQRQQQDQQNQQSRLQDQQSRQQADANKAQEQQQKDAQRRSELQRLGYSPDTVNRVLSQENLHNQRADALKVQRQQQHDDAVQAARLGITPSQVAAQRQQTLLAQPQPQQQPLQQLNSTLGAMTNAFVPELNKSGQQMGQAVTQGLSNGMQQGQGQVNGAGQGMANGLIDQAKKKLGIASPSTVMADVGADVGAGMAQGLAAASASVAPVASNTGLQVGYIWAQSVVGGALSVMKSSDFATASVTGVGSALAETALGQLGLLGPAGSGAEIYKTSAVTISPSGSSTAVTPQVNATINVTVGDQPMQVIAQQVVEANMTGLSNAISVN
jgi:hypothetical protein